ncbi:MAG: glycosyl hydrolase 2 galactose-binding domain-containing protein [Anaerolineae bacterium]
MRKVYDLANLDWELLGYIPHLWELEKSNALPQAASCEVAGVPARVPGSVQAALRAAGIIPDWNVGGNARLCEWVENRHWIYRAVLPDAGYDPALSWELECLGLDYTGWVYLNNRRVGTFTGSHLPHRFALPGPLVKAGSMLEIIFGLPPRWLGQFGYTSQMTEWKTRFNYTWDWAPRLVQAGISDAIRLVGSDGESLTGLRCSPAADLADGTGSLRLQADVSGQQAAVVRCELRQGDRVIVSADFRPAEVKAGVTWAGLPVDLWWPNLEGDQPLYDLSCRLLAADGAVLDEAPQRVGFRHVAWRPCAGAPPEADPWQCVVNGRPVFLQGFNYQPVRCNYADVTAADHAARLAVYKDIGTNCFRINACGYLESEAFYNQCDELGIMVWQEFPLTSSGVENWPPEDPASIEALAEIARSFIHRRQHHPALILWGGSNEQMGSLDGGKVGMGKPCPPSQPTLARLGQVVAREDPTRRYVPTSPLGPRASSNPADAGRGLHWDVHGPNLNFESDAEMQRYWAADDALFRAEIYVSGAAAAETIQRYRGEWEAMPASKDNPLWRRPTPWWNDWDELVRIHGREPASLEEYVAWSQAKQAERLGYAMRACKARFPGIGGALMWGSHDTTPMPVNTTIMDFDAVVKPAAAALKRAWRG